MNKYIFICGLHKSGTTILSDCLCRHPQISSFKNTGYPKNEGQFLQSVYPKAYEYGGPGEFGFSESMHLTENSDLISDNNKKKLLMEWHSHWDNEKSVFLEKSPPNILKTRFLQSMIPNSYFIFIMRHPISVSYSTLPWSKTSLVKLISHWIHCHKIMRDDIKHLNNSMIIKYENFVNQPESYIESICDFTQIKKSRSIPFIINDTNKKYFTEWANLLTSKNEHNQNEVAAILEFEQSINIFGYSFKSK